MYRRILVPLDGSPLAEQVLPYVRALAGAIQPMVHLFQAYEPEEPRQPARRGDGNQGQNVPGAQQQAETYLEGIKADLQDLPLTVSVMVREGNAAERIIEEADREPGTLIAMATHGRSGLSRWALGSVADKVLRATVSPLLLIRAGEPQGDASSRTPMLRTLVVPLDGSPEAEKILLPVIALSTSMKPAEVVLVRVLAVPTEMERQAESDARGYLERVRGQLVQPGRPSVKIELRYGPPAEAIVQVAHAMPEPLIAMTTHGRSGVKRWVLGSVADRTVRTANFPVLVVKPAAERRIGC